MLYFFFSSRRRHTRCREVSWARRCVQETAPKPQNPKIILKRVSDDTFYFHSELVLDIDEVFEFFEVYTNELFLEVVLNQMKRYIANSQLDGWGQPFQHRQVQMSQERSVLRFSFDRLGHRQEF
eukprot:TRINITY_DN46630_c0_g1_i1.p2 TRINITY_DN46630_c0_g1~~TRINITY_DN46630_c0_g1_i1.p2  ORF type:complete len:124 (+),score=25.64 TRINITY_DN46630_c0_g1_i1:76-447(+)